MLRRILPAWLLMLALAATAAAPVAAQEHQHAKPDGAQVGQVEFPTSCSAEAQQHFVPGLAMLHSFWFEEAHDAFTRAAAADPKCAMAHWGVAMTMMGNPMTRAAPSAERFAQGRAAAEKARALVGAASHREQMYVDALMALFDDADDADHLTRMARHEKSLEALVAAHPEDAEAAIFYGRAVVANAPPTDLKFERQRHAATILNPLFERMPGHPGLAHYIIHAFDAPPIAHLGLEAAKRYADIAPSAPHALHMPSHIFTRLGYWDESIETNQRSAQAEPNPNAAVHPMDYMVYAFLQQGRDREAGEIVAQARELPDRFYGGVIGYNFAAMHARYALERGRWNDAAALKVPSGAPPYVEAVTHFARAIGAARGNPKDIPLANDAIRRLQELEDELKKSRDTYWATIVGAQKLAASAWTAFATARTTGERTMALGLARQAAELEESVEKHPVTPGPLLPARELEGDLLMVSRKPDGALAAYEATLKRDPRRARALLGAARAADAAGQKDLSKKYYTEAAALLEKGDPERPDVVEARKFVARN